MELLRVNGVRLEVQRIGGPAGGPSPVVFLHDGLGSVATWRDWPALLCARAGRQGIVYSRRGYGQSDPIPDVRGTNRLGADYMHREALEVLPQLLDALGISRPVLLGHSDGGTIALIHASQFPVTACVVMAPHVMVEDVSIRSIEQAREAFESGELRQRLERYHQDVDSAFWQWNDTWLSPAFRDFDIRPDCRRIAAPVLALQGEDDPFGTLRQIDDIAPTRSSVQLRPVAQCGHAPHRDQADITTEEILRFLADLDEAPPHGD